MILDSRHCCVCSGKGIATTTTTTRSNQNSPSHKVITKTITTPTMTHHALIALYNHGHIHHWLQQYHDGLPQQCGFPQERLNEIHGSNYDPSNPCVPGGGTLRADLFDTLLAWEERADLVLCLDPPGPRAGGGMSSDRVFHSVSRRGRKGLGIGGVRIGLQHTPEDHCAALKIYAQSDHVMEALLQQLHIHIQLPRPTTPVTPPPAEDSGSLVVPQEEVYSWNMPQDCLTATKDVFRLPYDGSGNRLLSLLDSHHTTTSNPFSNNISHDHSDCDGRDDGNSKNRDRNNLTLQHYTILDLQQGSLPQLPWRSVGEDARGPLSDPVQEFASSSQRKEHCYSEQKQY